MTEVTRLDLSQGPYEFTACGLSLAGESTPQEWERCGEILQRVDEARQWAIGDWLRDGKQHYGDGLYKRAAEITGLDQGTLRSFASLASSFHLSLRRDKLSYGHHKESQGIKLIAEHEDGKLYLSNEPDRDTIAELLGDAEKKGWPVVELRATVREHKEWQRQHIAAANEPEKYAVIYADPPWQYSSGDQHTDEEQETVIGDHYPSMSLRDICALPQAKLAATDCVLFMWCTSPTLEEAFEVVNAWGFKYKASMIWDKVAHNVGHYVSVRHELLLICTKGIAPKVPRLADSVYEEQRTEHSRKPAYFKDLIAELYPNGKRIEFFCRGDAGDGWDAWGNEAND